MITALLKEIVLLIIWAFLQSPVLRLSAKLAKFPAPSIQAAFLLGLISGATSVAVSLMLYPLYHFLGTAIAEGISLGAAMAATIWAYGYFLRNGSGNSIGIVPGAKVFVIQIALLIAFLIPFALLLLALAHLIR